MADVNTKIISYGHKLSFAYSEPNVSDKELEKLAKSICITNQLLCSSCQGIFVDTNSKDEQLKFGERFFNLNGQKSLASKAVELIARQL